MATLEPIVLVDARSTDNRAKGGGGGPKDEIVPVDGALRATLAGQLSDAISLIDSLQAEFRSVGVPLVIRLRERALAKSNRPYGLLAEAGLTPEAAAGPGELVARASSARLADLRHRVESSRTKADIFAISSIESLNVWRPVGNAFVGASLASLAEVFGIASSAGRAIRLEFFPWVNLDTRFGQDSLAERLARIGLQAVAVSKNHRRPRAYFEVAHEVDVEELAKLYGLRTGGLAPQYALFDTASGAVDGVEVPAVELRGEPPTVGLLDSGVDCPALEPWIVASKRYDPVEAFDPSHGTFVAGLVTSSRALNADDRFPTDSAKIVDAQVLPKGLIDEYLLVERIEEVVSDFAKEGVHVWNCSFAALRQLDPLDYSSVAEEMDRISSENGVLFVQAVGNYTDPPTRQWPVPVTPRLLDGVASPADAVSSLAVGSLSHLGGLAPPDCPASYSRRGPSFGGQMKPDVTYWSGDFATAGTLGGLGVRSFACSGAIAENVGTSFATPVVSAIAANVWADLEDGPAARAADAALVKGLVVHSAATGQRVQIDGTRQYFGMGVPSVSHLALAHGEDAFTTVHRAVLRPGVDWWKDPFPVPASLVTGDGKLRAEIFMTLSFSPLVDAAFGSECVRTSVEVSFGSISEGANGPTIAGVVPVDQGYSWEAERIEAGKWSPIRTHHVRFPRGKAGGSRWGLKATLTERTPGELRHEVIAYVIVTLKAVDGSQTVRQDGMNELRAQGHAFVPVVNAARLRVSP